MKRDEEKTKNQPTQERQNQDAEITSASVENAHATGDGAVKKTDELLPAEDDESSTETSPY